MIEYGAAACLILAGSLASAGLAYMLRGLVDQTAYENHLDKHSFLTSPTLGCMFCAVERPSQTRELLNKTFTQYGPDTIHERVDKVEGL